MSQAITKKPAHVLVFGTFDLLHPGHKFFLRAAKRLGKSLTVVVARDRNVHKLKGHKPIQTEGKRLNNVRRLGVVNRATLGQREFSHRYALIRKLKPDIIALGYDQMTRTISLKRDLKKLGLNIKVIRLKPFHPKRYKSSLLRTTLAKR